MLSIFNQLLLEISPSYIHRSLYIEDILYTISDNMIKINNLENLNEIKSMELVLTAIFERGEEASHSIYSLFQ